MSTQQKLANSGKAAFGGLFDPATSECRVLWGAIALTFLGHLVPSFREALNATVAQVFPHYTWDMILEGLVVTYVPGRMISKGVKANKPTVGG